MSLGEIFQYYCWFSLAVGLVSGFQFAIEYFLKSEELRTSLDKINSVMLRRSIQAGHIQKEVYEDRVVYYERDSEGGSDKRSHDWLRRMNRDHPNVIASLVVVICIIYSSIFWPREAWGYLTAIARAIRRTKRARKT